MIVVADTSGMLAMFNRSDPEHFAVRRAADSASALVVSPMALTEVHHVASVRAGRKVADRIIELLAERVASSRIVLAEVDAIQLATSIKVRANYDGLDLDLVDAVCVVLAAEFDTDAILSLDRRDLRALRPLNGYPAFRVLPDDAD
ncbi:type II toxin-antitoxin system VapC family toxin [Nocardia caishijiensis]|uniref:Nucleic acid-binding protein n=1 Tax=Nocardia caishijiensis TaxID=184756 RepID=A0ABQ6YQW2_9NOCA|nr:PIN domain-containing protein [Nocardia caishijiensis]KAF0848175.1 putative nucleic acid-binding protein [Nocardia caishijiensis]